MKTGLKSEAFTIVEVMIVLAVTSALLIMSLRLITGQQGKTEFVQAINDIQSVINDTINHVSTGFYPKAGNFTCVASLAGARTDGKTAPVVTSVASNQGTNKDCAFVGEAIHFTQTSAYTLYNVIGLRLVTGSNQAANAYSTAIPTAMAPGLTYNTGFPSNLSITSNMLYGLTVQNMTYVNSSNVSTTVGAVAFIGGLTSTQSQVTSGSQQVSLVAIKDDLRSSSEPQTVDYINNLNNVTGSNPEIVNPAGGVVICFKSGGSKQSGQLTIGSNGRQVTTSLSIKNTTDCT